MGLKSSLITHLHPSDASDPPLVMSSSSSPPPPPPPPACSQPEMLAGVLRESRRVVAAHTRHFLALSVLFLLPLSCLLSSSPSLLPSPHRRPLLRSSVISAQFPIAAAVALLSAALLLAASGAAAITGSVHRSFFGRPVRLLPALASLPSALPRLLLTLLAALLPLALLLLLVSSPLLLLRLPLPLALAALSAVSVLYFQIYFSLAFSIAVLESSSGFGPLRRSAHLVRGMRGAALCLNLLFSAVTGAVLWGFSLSWVSVTGGWREVLPVVAKTVFCSAVTAVLLLYWLVTNVVMYLYCKALHGELEREIVEEFAWEYVCLPFDDQKVPHVVSVVQQ